MPERMNPAASSKQGDPMIRLTYNDLKAFTELAPYLADLEAVIDDARREAWKAGWTDAEECYGLTTEQARREAHNRKEQHLARDPQETTS